MTTSKVYRDSGLWIADIDGQKFQYPHVEQAIARVGFHKGLCEESECEHIHTRSEYKEKIQFPIWEHEMKEEFNHLIEHFVRVSGISKKQPYSVDYSAMVHTNLTPSTTTHKYSVYGHIPVVRFGEVRMCSGVGEGSTFEEAVEDFMKLREIENEKFNAKYHR